MKFDETNLRDVEGIVKRLNPRTRGMDLVAYMKDMARRVLADKASYCATLGFMLTSYQPSFDPGEMHVKASIDTCAFFGVKFTIERAEGQGPGVERAEG